MCLTSPAEFVDETIPVSEVRHTFLCSSESRPWQERDSYSFVWNMHFVRQSIFFWFYAIYLVLSGQCLDQTNVENSFFIILIFFALQKESEKEDKFNCTLQHVKALLRFVKGVYSPSSSKELTWARQKKTCTRSRSRYVNLYSSICIPCTLNTPPGDWRHRSSEYARK